jgi:hypothetical protein
MISKLQDEASPWRAINYCKKAKKTKNFHQSILRGIGMLLLALTMPFMVSAQTGTVDPICPTNPPSDIIDSIGEAGDYDLVYALTVPDTQGGFTGNVEYLVDNSDMNVDCLNRVAYLVLKENRWIWVSMDAFTDDLVQLGLPEKDVEGKEFVFQQNVTNLNVVSTSDLIPNQGYIAEGNIEIWPYGYGANNAAGVPNASDTEYDWGDAYNESQCFGSFQVHDFENEQVLFAVNAWKNNVGLYPSLGIGNNPFSGEKDWTFPGNSRYLNTRCVYIFVSSSDAGQEPECTLIASEEIHLHGDNQVSGNVCVTDSDGEIKLHENTHVDGAVNAAGFDIDDDSSAVSMDMSPADVDLPPFYVNPFCDDASIEVRVEEGDDVTLDGQIYKKVEIKEGGKVTFTNPNVFICELKTEKATTINFEDCANLFIKKNLEFDEMTSFNADGNNVTIYAMDNVKVKKGSSITAHIYANDKEIVAEGDSNKPTDMKGVFIAKKIKGNKYVTWVGNDYCNPCPVEIPEVPASCECNGGMTSVTFSYDGDLADLGTNSGSISDNGDGTYTVSDNGLKLEKDLQIYANGNTAEIHTSCSQDILGVAFAGGITVVGYVDTESNVTDIESCPVTPVDCDCNGGMTSVTFAYMGSDALSSNSGTITNNGDGTYTVATGNGDKLEKDLEIYSGGNTAEIHTSCSQDILGVTFPGGVAVVGYTDTEGNMTSVDGCSQAPGPDCECNGGMTSVTFSYDGEELADLGTNSGSITDNGDGTYTVSDNGLKLEKDLEIYANGNTAEIHTSCSQDILGVTFSGGITVVGYVDTEGSVTSIETCPVTVECDCSGGLVEMTFEYAGEGIPSTNSGTITDNGNGTYTVYDNGVKLEKDLEITVVGGLAEIHTSCSQDILGVTFAGGVKVIGHVDANGNVCTISSSSRSAGRSGAENENVNDKQEVAIDEIQDVISGFNVKAWPIPSDNAFNIRVASDNRNDKVAIQVIDITGKLVLVDSFDANKLYQFGTKLQSGIYFVRIKQGNNLQIKRVVKH